MKKWFKLLLTMLLIGVLLCAYLIPAYATGEGITPRFTNCETANFYFSLSDNEAFFSASYVAREDTFLNAELRVTVEKKVLGLFWRDVGGQWVGYSTQARGTIRGSMPADGTGTYRANFKLIVYGNQGIADVIEDTIEVRYS